MRACVRVCVRACVRACVRVYDRERAHVCVRGVRVTIILWCIGPTQCDIISKHVTAQQTACMGELKHVSNSVLSGHDTNRPSMYQLLMGENVAFKCFP